MSTLSWSPERIKVSILSSKLRSTGKITGNVSMWILFYLKITTFLDVSPFRLREVVVTDHLPSRFRSCLRTLNLFWKGLEPRLWKTIYCNSIEELSKLDGIFRHPTLIRLFLRVGYFPGPLPSWTMTFLSVQSLRRYPLLPSLTFLTLTCPRTRSNKSWDTWSRSVRLK